jgi:tetratricopeptide (TPR) repeat protein
MNLKKQLFFILTLSFSVAITAQKFTVQKYQQLELNNEKKLLKKSLSYADATTAIYAMHNIIALEGENSIYKDSLAIIYYNMGKFNSSFLATKELLATKPNNLLLLEINAVSLTQLGDVKEAVNTYEKLVPLSKNQYHAYQLGYLQFSIKRLLEAQKSLAYALSLEDLKDAQLSFPSLKDEKKQQSVPLKAALYNLEGLVLSNLKDNTAAKTAFENALKVMPTFEQAEQNMFYINTVLETDKKEKE